MYFANASLFSHKKSLDMGLIFYINIPKYMPIPFFRNFEKWSYFISRKFLMSKITLQDTLNYLMVSKVCLFVCLFFFLNDGTTISSHKKSCHLYACVYLLSWKNHIFLKKRTVIYPKNHLFTFSMCIKKLSIGTVVLEIASI